VLATQQKVIIKNHSVAIENSVQPVQKVVLYMTGAEMTARQNGSTAKLNVFSAAPSKWAGDRAAAVAQGLRR
jgi:hypothetical protein